MKTVIIVAGGQGMRVGSDRPKQFLYLGGQPLVMHTMDVFWRYDREIKIILGLEKGYFSYWESVCSQLRFDIPHNVTPGGKTRYHTVKNALQKVPEGSIVAIHDAVRPFVYKDTLDRCFEEARTSGAAIPCIDVPDTLREIQPGSSRWVDRDKYRLVQTPQVFQYELLVKAYDQKYSESFTDDASVLENAGFPVSVVKGNYENRKITHPGDLVFAEALIGIFKKKSGLY